MGRSAQSTHAELKLGDVRPALGLSSLLSTLTDEFMALRTLRTCPADKPFLEWLFRTRTLENSHQKRTRVGSETR